MKQVALLALAFGLALLAQRQFGAGGITRDALLLYLAAAVAFILAVRRSKGEMPAPDNTATPVESPQIARLALAAGGAILALVGMSRFYGNITSNLGLWLWLAGMVILALSFAASRPQFLGKFFREHRTEILIFVFLMAVALFMRVYHVGQFPAGAYLDEADNGLEALRLGDSSYYIPFTRASNGHPTLYLYLLSFGFKLFGETVIAMRLVTVLIGVGTVAAFYFLARELFGVRAAQFATFGLAVSRWHVNFSRVVFEGVLTPLFAVLAFLFLVRAIRSGRWRDYIWAGLALGLGMQGYIGYRVFPAIALLYIVIQMIAMRGALRAWWKGLLVLLVAVVIGVGPLAVYFLKYPEDFMHRASQASVMQDVERQGNYDPLRANIRKTALMFNQKGDPRPRHNLPHEPMLDPWSGMFFMLGLGYAVYRSRDPNHLILWLWLPIGALPGVLSLADSNPHSLRTIVNLPAVFLLIAAFWKPAIELFHRTFRKWGWQPVRALGIIVLALSGWSNFDVYFNEQAGNRSVYYDFDPGQNRVAEFILDHKESHRLLVSPALTNHSAIKFLDYRVPYEDFILNQHLPLRDIGPQDVMYVLELAHAMVVQRLQELYPAGELQKHSDRYGQLTFYSYEVGREDMLSIQGLQGSYYAGEEAEGVPAFTRRDPVLDFSWDEPPLPLPYTIQWAGSLYVPAYGDYQFLLETGGGLGALTLDDELVVKVEDGVAQKVKRLAAGFHPIQVSFIGAESPAGISLRWVIPGREEKLIAQEDFYDEELSQFGLLGRYFRGADNFSGMPALVQIDAYVAPNDPLPAPYSIEWLGKIYAPQTGHYTFATNSDDGSFVFIDEQLVVDNGGHHGDIYKEGSITLDEGFHDLRLRYFQVDGGRKMEFWWVSPGGPKELVPASYLLPPGVSLDMLPEPPQAPAAPPPVSSDLPVAEAGPLAGVTPLAAWGVEGAGEGEFRSPRGVAMGPQGWVYVADAGNGRVQCFDSDGTFIRSWSDGAEPLVEPFDIAVDSAGRVYVLDVGRQAIARYSGDGEFQVEFGAGLGFYGPRGLGLDADGNIYVADTGGSRVVKLSPDGQMLAVLAPRGQGKGQVDQPTDVAVDQLGRVYITDLLNTRLQVLDASGDYLGEWPIGGANTTDSPHLDIDAEGRILLTDPEAHIVIAYDTQGNVLGQWGGEGVAPGQFRKPLGIGVGPGGLVAVSDLNNYRVQIFSIDSMAEGN